MHNGRPLSVALPDNGHFGVRLLSSAATGSCRPDAAAGGFGEQTFANLADRLEAAVQGVDECEPARSDAPIIEGCYTDPQMTECLEIMRLMLSAACHHYQFISGRQRPVNHC